VVGTTALPKIYCICLCRNEADIIERTLLEAARWSDFIYVYDNGSTDGTWEQVIALAATKPRIIPFRRDAAPFNDNLRRVPFLHFRGASESGDWWCRLDADEIYIDSPREFLASVPPEYDTVWSASFQYYFTDEDTERYRADPSLYADNVPLELKCRYYSVSSSEIRFFKYHPRLRWDTGGFPYPLLKSFQKRIRLKHYQYRSPRQIEQRLATRRDAVRRGMFRHERRPTFAELFSVDFRKYRRRDVPDSWMSRVVPASCLTRDDGASYIVPEGMLPPIVPIPDSPRRRLRRAWRRTIAQLASQRSPDPNRELRSIEGDD
jgi:glycosyltransferase involved in cell wall biosynthesis